MRLACCTGTGGPPVRTICADSFVGHTSRVRAIVASIDVALIELEIGMALSFEARSRLEARVEANILAARRDPQGYERRVVRWLWLGEKLCALAGFLRVLRDRPPSLSAHSSQQQDGEEALAQSALVGADYEQSSSSSSSSSSVQSAAGEARACPATGELSRSDAPALFAMIDELCTRAGIDVSISVVINSGVDASVTTRYNRTRALGTWREELHRLAPSQCSPNKASIGFMLGRCLLKTVCVQELRAVVAHEIGHVVGRQTHLSYRCLILNNRLARIGSPRKVIAAPNSSSLPERAERAEPAATPDRFEQSTMLALLGQSAIGWLRRRLQALAFPVFRNAEFEADCFAAALVGSGQFGRALIRVGIANTKFGHYLPGLIQELDEKGCGGETDQLDERVLKLLLSQRSDPNVVHPCLSDRLAWINAAPVAPPPITISALSLLEGDMARAYGI